MQHLSMKVWILTYSKINLLNYILLSSTHFRGKCFTVEFPEWPILLAKGNKNGRFICLLEKVMKLFCKDFPLGAFQKQLGQFYVKNQWTKHLRKADFLSQQLDSLQVSLTRGPIPPGNRMNTRYKKIKIVWTSSCSTCSS